MEKYSCEHCNYVTHKKYNLNRHMKKHEKSKKKFLNYVNVEKRINHAMGIISM